MKLRRLLLPTLILALGACAPRPSSNRVYQPRRAFPAFPGVLKNAAFAPLPLGSVKPRGWLRAELQAQADGLGGHIEEIWPDLGPESGWKGGRGESWERGPYYLDGLVPLAFLLDDPVLLGRMQAWMDWNLEHQAPNGSFGPPRGADWWPDMVFLKALTQYEEASGDARVGPFLQRYFAYLRSELPRRRLDAWRVQVHPEDGPGHGEARVSYMDRWQYFRWTEMVQSLLWQERRGTHEDLLAVARELKRQGFDWERSFRRWSYPAKARPDQVFLVNHGVNAAMAVKANALAWLLEGKPSQRAAMLEPLQVLNRWHGQANGAFAADEQLAGLDPSQGTELCAVVEELYSLETLLWISGEAGVGDALERLAFNALPATFSPDGWRHQYDQQVNQIEVSDAPRAWSNNGPQANLFGLEPQWGCCTANFHQGWPKLVEHLWMASSDGGLALMSFAPSRLELDLPSGARLRVEVTGSYPFDGGLELLLNLERETTFPLRLRIPGWVRGASVKVNGKEQKPVAGSFLKIERAWRDGDRVQVRLALPAVAGTWGGGTVVMRGPLLLALPLAAREQFRGSERWSDQELFPLEPWNLAPMLKPGQEIPASQIEAKLPQGRAFDPAAPPLKVRVKARSVANWTRQENSAGPLPERPLLEGFEREVGLIPYGAAKLRVTVFPRVP